MGSLDRPGGQPDLPDETAREKGVPGPESGPWLNLDNESDDELLSFLGLDRDDPRPDLTPPRWNSADKVVVPEFSVRAKDWDVVPGIDPPDYRNPDAKDSLKLERSQEVIVGKQGSEDNPRRVAEVQDDGRLTDKPDAPEPEVPSGEELLEPDDSKKSKFDRGLDQATNAETIEGTQDTVGEYGRIFQDLHGERPTGTATVARMPDQPVVLHPPASQIDIGLLAVLPFIPAVFAARRNAVTLGHAESEQTRGDRPDAGD
jgi:hypothetical protein